MIREEETKAARKGGFLRDKAVKRPPGDIVANPSPEFPGVRPGDVLVGEKMRPRDRPLAFKRMKDRGTTGCRSGGVNRALAAFRTFVLIFFSGFCIIKVR